MACPPPQELQARSAALDGQDATLADWEARLAPRAGLGSAGSGMTELTGLHREKAGSPTNAVVFPTFPKKIREQTEGRLKR